MSLSEYLAPLVGRLAFGWFFLLQAVNYADRWGNTIALMELQHIPSAPFVLALTLLLLVVGSLSLIFGFHARYGAMLLFAVTLVAAVTMHSYWLIHQNPVARQAEFEIFAYDIAIAGGLLLLVGQGAGPLAADNKIAGGKKKK